VKPLTIGQVAKSSGVGVETVRFYERQGLIAEPPRTKAGYRTYPAEVIARIRFIQRAKQLGFSLREIKELLSLRIEAGTTCDDIRRRAEAKIADIDQKIQSLQRMKKALSDLAAACRNRGPLTIGECPILQALEAEQPHDP